MKNLADRIESLKEKHQILDKQIDMMEAAGDFKDNDINFLKKERLLLRDNIVILEQQLLENHNATTRPRKR
jgi:uncharacterized protein YdcH (DUF465 family)